MNNPSKKSADSKPKVESEIELAFTGTTVKASWYHPDLKPVICALCGKNCKFPCVNVNPYCG